mmetsp:Transcript_18625/g.44835  ORF Transcript_18625/g.44835 Transcript_18625/m.44835 type:complete len:738 (-) Transcript_18625:209-2422(-)
MGFRVVDKSPFAYETDLPSASRNIHPSGILHAFCSDSPPPKNQTSDEKHTLDADDGTDHPPPPKKQTSEADDNTAPHDPLKKQTSNTDDSTNPPDSLEKQASGADDGASPHPPANEQTSYTDDGTAPPPSKKEPSDADGSTGADHGNIGREKHAFVWIANTLHIEVAMKLLEQDGFPNSGIVFIPYSTKRNWMARYPDAHPELECNENGKCGAVIKSCPSGPVEHDDGDGANEYFEVVSNKKKGSKKRKKPSRRTRAPNMLRDDSFMPDAERDELHVEIFNYLSWLHAKLADLERKDAELDESIMGLAKNIAVPVLGHGDSENEDDENEEVDHQEDRNQGKSARHKANNSGVNISELKGVLDKLKLTFAIIPNINLEEEEAVAAAAASTEVGMANLQQEQQQQEGQNHHQIKEGTADEKKPQQLHKSTEIAATTHKEALAPQKEKDGPPFLEEALFPALCQLVDSREVAGRLRRRSRRKRPRPTPGGRCKYKRSPGPVGDFEDMFRRLVEYKEEYGDCIVKRTYQQDRKLACWVNAMRNEKRSLLKRGIEFEKVHPGKKILSKTITAERLQRLNSLGFLWSVSGPKVSWEKRFQDCLEYCEENGRWPSQSMGSLGEWVHKQRTLYSKNDANYMKDKAPKLDAVGFEWTPRGNTRMTWDEGFGMLMDFGRTNGHYNVSYPDTTSEDVDKRSDEFRLYKWVESLHGMYRSYKLGRQSGSLTDERVVLLIKHGFSFRDRM